MFLCLSPRPIEFLPSQYRMQSVCGTLLYLLDLRYFMAALVLFISRTVFLHSVSFYCNAGPIKKKRFYVTVALFHHVFVSCNITFYTIDPNESEQKRVCVRRNAYVSIVNMTLAFVNFMRFLYISLCQAIATLYNVHAFDGLLFSHTSSLLISILFIFNESMLRNRDLFMSHFLVFILHIFQPPTNNGISSGDVLAFRLVEGRAGVYL